MTVAKNISLTLCGALATMSVSSRAFLLPNPLRSITCRNEIDSFGVCLYLSSWDIHDGDNGGPQPAYWPDLSSSKYVHVQDEARSVEIDDDDDDAYFWTPRVGLPGDMYKGKVVQPSETSLNDAFKNFTPDWSSFGTNVDCPAEAWSTGAELGPPPEGMLWNGDTQFPKAKTEEPPQQEQIFYPDATLSVRSQAAAKETRFGW